ncbi:hypothetical protein [Thiocystis violacea]|uniref:hypothetical protein n=1 Tax=Thiocystis violacea TaxID=13725 RepID=UPI0019066F5E|nr:hypothetical protein [Thiocystis violacea]MBK1720498.1 hypothetical protein [Thiocystis violacea]
MSDWTDLIDALTDIMAEPKPRRLAKAATKVKPFVILKRRPPARQVKVPRRLILVFRSQRLS